jgi:hypothetical protein
MAIVTTGVMDHARYLAWSGKAVAAANRDWRRRRPDDGGDLMTRDALDHHLYRWAIDSGLLDDPGPRRIQPVSAFVAAAFARRRRAVVAEARAYWRMTIGAQMECLPGRGCPSES